MGLVAVALLVPTHATKETQSRVFTEGLRIEIDRGSPAYAALEDSLMADSVVASAIAAPTTKKVETLTIEAGSRNEAKLTQLARGIIEANDYERFQMARANQVSQRPRVTASVVQLPVKTISLSGLKISREELVRGLLMPIAEPVLATAPKQAASRWAPAQVPAPKPRPPANNALASAPRQPAEPSGGRGFVQNPSDKVAGLLANREQQLTISGPLLFTGGVALTSADEKVVVYREMEGEVFEVAQVSLREGSYEIFVDRPEGELIAELRSGVGEVLGRGRYDLLALPETQNSQPLVSSVGIKIRPLPHGVYGRVLDSDSPIQTRPLSQAIISFDQLPYTNTTNKEGVFEQPEIFEQSSVIVRAERAGYWGTLAFAQTGKAAAADLPLFSDRSIRALTAAAGAELKMSSVIWGKVTRAGKPVAGAKVDLMTTERSLRPIYFNSLAIPDSSLTSTSANGLYAFVSVDAGSHAVQAMDGQNLTEPSVFPTENRSVTVLDLDLAADRTANVNVFDAFKTDWAMAAQIASVGRENGLKIGRTGEGKASFTGGAAPLILDADGGGNYEKSRVAFARHAKQLNFPMIQTVWLDGLAGAMRLNRSSSAGTIVGFIQGRNGYKVAMDEAALRADTRIIYFDEKGDWTRKKFGTPGGGFVVFNAPSGFRSVVLELSKSQRSFATTVLVEPNVANVISQKID